MSKSKKVKIFIFTTLFLIIFLLCSGLFIVFSPLVNLYGHYDISFDNLQTLSDTVNFYSKDGKVEFSEYLNGKYVKINQLQPYVYNAFVSVEDKRFYSHNGVDYYRIAGAFYDNIKSKKFKEGASTITQQLVKNTLLSSEKTIERKIKEIKLAQRIEKIYSKEEILEKYLNAIYFGSNIYGIENASEYYFNKNAKNLTIAESAFLASIINNPTLYNPYKNRENLLKRKDLVLRLMLNNDFINDEEYKLAISEEIDVKKEKINSNQYFNNVINTLKKQGYDSFDKKLNITIPLDMKLSEKVKEILEKDVGNYGVNLLIANNETSEVITNLSNYKCDVSNIRFLPGSTIKPILCYAPLLENNEIFTVSLVNDEPYEINGYSPQNYNKKYRGQITQRQALAYSSNSVALQNLEKIGIDNAINFAKRTGLNFDEEDYQNYAIALGGLKYGFTLNELLNAYLTIARLGKKSAPSYVSCIDKNNSVVFLNSLNDEQIFKSSTGYLLIEMMRDCVEYGTGKSLNRHKNVVGKTGTVGNKIGNTQCYCIAISPKFTVLCHISSLDDKPLPLSVMGGTLPAQISSKVFDVLQDNSAFEIPDTVIKKDILIDELKKGNIVLAPWYKSEINKKSCYFSKENIPQLNNSFSEFINSYNLDNSYHFDIFNSLNN